MKRADQYEPFRRLLRAYGVEGERLAKVLGCCPHTARARMKEPGTMTYNEMRCLCIGYGIPADEIRGALRFGR